jgi:hypothetical protein
VYRARRTGARQHRPPNLHVNDQQRRPKLRGRMRFDARHRRYCKSVMVYSKAVRSADVF